MKIHIEEWFSYSREERIDLIRLTVADNLIKSRKTNALRAGKQTKSIH